MDIETMPTAQIRAEIDDRDARIAELEAREAKLRNTLTKVEAWFAGEDGPLSKLWEDGDIGAYDDNPTDWEQTLFDIRDWKNGCVPTASLGYGTEWPAVTLYREILAALQATPDADADAEREGE